MFRSLFFCRKYVVIKFEVLSILCSVFGKIGLITDYLIPNTKSFRSQNDIFIHNIGSERKGTCKGGGYGIEDVDGVFVAL
jgi:hypothetical protein